MNHFNRPRPLDCVGVSFIPVYLGPGDAGDEPPGCGDVAVAVRELAGALEGAIDEVCMGLAIARALAVEVIKGVERYG